MLSVAAMWRSRSAHIPVSSCETVPTPACHAHLAWDDASRGGRGCGCGGSRCSAQGRGVCRGPNQFPPPAGMGKTTFIKNLFASYAKDPDFKVASASTPTSREARNFCGHEMIIVHACSKQASACRGLPSSQSLKTLRGRRAHDHDRLLRRSLSATQRNCAPRSWWKMSRPRTASTTRCRTLQVCPSSGGAVHQLWPSMTVITSVVIGPVLRAQTRQVTM